jgi:hypothetical protein
MADEAITDYEDLTNMKLTAQEVDDLVGGRGECVFNWTTKEGYPVGVVVAYVYRHGKFWTTCAARRKRVPALKVRPQSAVVINRNGNTVSFKGDSRVHTPGDAGHAELKEWFYDALSQTETDPTNDWNRNFRKFLDSPHRVIIETDARLVVGFSTSKFGAQTAAAIAAGHGVDG